MAKKSEVDKKLRKILKLIDFFIKDRRIGLEMRMSLGQDEVGELWSRAGAETLGAWEGARNIILAEFPHLREKKGRKD